MHPHHFTYTPKGPFHLVSQAGFFGGWNTLTQDASAMVLSFPVEGWKGSAAVVLRQGEGGIIAGEIYAPEACWEQAKKQALATLSLDIDATGWPEVGERDAVIGSLQRRYEYLRPELFYSPYEAAAHFIIGHRISMVQGRAIRKRMGEELGEQIAVGEQKYAAFPRPEVLMHLTEYPSLNEVKLMRLKAVAQAALDGLLDRAYLRSIPSSQALAELEMLPGVGPFFSQGILARGAGLVDEVTDEDMSKYAIKNAYHLTDTPDYAEVVARAETWRPFRMWTTVLLHVWVRREVGMPEKRTFTKK